jgi:hypothetical protein
MTAHLIIGPLKLVLKKLTPAQWARAKEKKKVSK